MYTMCRIQPIRISKKGDLATNRRLCHGTVTHWWCQRSWTTPDGSLFFVWLTFIELGYHICQSDIRPVMLLWTNVCWYDHVITPKSVLVTNQRLNMGITFLVIYLIDELLSNKHDRPLHDHSVACGGFIIFILNLPQRRKRYELGRGIERSLWELSVSVLVLVCTMLPTRPVSVKTRSNRCHKR